MKTDVNPTIGPILEVSSRKRYNEKARLGRIYFTPQNETVLEHLFNRHDRPYKFYETLIPEALKQLGYTDSQINRVKFKWNVKAGCSMCPCSPGFIITGDGPFDYKDFYVKIIGHKTT